MKTSSKILLTVVGLAAVSVVGYRVANRPPDASLPLPGQALAILESGGCADCHSATPRLPFYAGLPLVGGPIRQHAADGYAAFDIEPLLAALRSGAAAGEVDLAKVERAMADGDMPLSPYPLMHWGSATTPAKAQAVAAWAREHRRERHGAGEFAGDPVRPLPDAVAYDAEKAALGELLYHDTRLSADGTVSCATCHGLATGGVDNLVYSKGIDGQMGGVNAPTVYNAYFNFVQFWDGRAADLAAQAAGPPLNPVEMGCATFDEIVERLAADKDFAQRFEAAYPEGLSEATITHAIAEFEKTLVTPNSAFDRYLKGDKTALTGDQIAGYEAFKANKCATCHAGAALGGLSYEMMGRRQNYFQDRELTQKSGLTDADNGRWAQTGVERDRYRFKTPILRNIALTWPYYHDGSVATLAEAVRMMAIYQVGVELDDAEVKQVAAFLESLTGEHNGQKLTNTNTLANAQ